ncbi:unnamed protein product [Cylicocyclus nassatus]|uniref:Uncharacterized protein n=1 Tax=Cylicocyclus nassatus TaxID=53992 RepID=A0AA36H0D8_CYLNA|nr:unnamed protein product [Cylicocyclus nassatus]
MTPPDLRFRDHWRGASRFRPMDHMGRSTVRYEFSYGKDNVISEENHYSTTTTSGHAVHETGSMASSPVTSISDEHTGDAWRDSPLRRDPREDMSPMSDNSTALSSNIRSVDSAKPNKPKTVEIKVQRTEKVERREKFDHNKDWLNNNDTYAMPRMQPSFGSRSSLSTSQARGESSDIDFSWIREEEKKLKNEKEYTKPLPECYFGMDPPKLEDNGNVRQREEKENLRRSNVRSTTAALEHELAKEKREVMKSRSSTHLEDRRQEISPRRDMGPMARRLHRMQREAEVANRDYGDHDDNRQRWRSSMAF